MKTLPGTRISRYLISSLLVVAAWSAAAQGQERTGIVVDKIIAKVDNFIVLRSELEGLYQNYLTDGNPPTEDARCRILSQLVLNKLMVAKAEIDSLIVTDLEVDNNTDQRMNYLLQTSNNSPEQLEKQWGKSLDQIRLELHDQIKEQLLAREMQRKMTRDVTITPSEVRKFFNRIPADSLPFYNADVEIGQIVKFAQVSYRQKEAARNQLIDLRNRILSGEDFHELANKFSDDPSVRMNAGEMGWTRRGAMVSQFEATAFRLKVGEISEPFETQYGFHILQLLGRRGNEYNSRHILIAATPSDDDVKASAHFLDSIRTLIMAKTVSFETAAREFSDDQMTKGRGGYFTDSDGGSKVSLKELDPIVYFAIDSMKVGDISRPASFRTEDQKMAVRILYFKTKFPPHQANLKDDWFRIQAAALAQKKDQVTEKWFEKSRADVFIMVDPAFKSCKITD
ncbi:MAG: peptidylprolyl isomerase [Cyclobacteriaceae bacterium]|nr:peptidylprolyl isomerase [Cyclobacteriaceae bacterium]